MLTRIVRGRGERVDQSGGIHRAPFSPARFHSRRSSEIRSQTFRELHALVLKMRLFLSFQIRHQVHITTQLNLIAFALVSLLIAFHHHLSRLGSVLEGRRVAMLWRPKTSRQMLMVKEQRPSMCRAVSGWMWHSGHIGLHWMFFFCSMSAVEHLP